MKKYRIEAWGDRGYYSVVEVGKTSLEDVLVAVCVYKKGAIEVKRRLDELEEKLSKEKQ